MTDDKKITYFYLEKMRRTCNNIIAKLDELHESIKTSPLTKQARIMDERNTQHKTRYYCEQAKASFENVRRILSEDSDKRPVCQYIPLKYSGDANTRTVRTDKKRDNCGPLNNIINIEQYRS